MEKLPYRKTKRLKGFDYSESGFYFITICTNNFKHYFGEIKNHLMFLNEAGCMLHREWYNLEKESPNILPREFIVMPNHIHGIIEIRNCLISTDNHEGYPYGNDGRTLGDVVGAFKSKTTVEYIKKVKTDSWLPFPGKMWQENYYERIISSEKEYDDIAGYIINNPVQWSKGRDMYG